MKKFILLFTILVIAVFANAQLTFQKTYGGISSDYGTSAQQIMDGGYIITGYTYSFGTGGCDIYLIKIDSSGNVAWSKTFSGPSIDQSNYVQQTTDGGFIIAGRSFGSGVVSPKVCLIRTDANGDLTWTKTFGGVTNEVGVCVQQSTDGGFIIAGITDSFGGGDNVYLIKTDINGDSLWTKTLGGTGDDSGRSVQQTTDGGFIIAGTYGLSNGAYDAYLIKTDSNGDVLWSKTFDGANSQLGNSVKQTTDGGYIIAGTILGFGAGSNDVYLIKTDVNGDLLWSKSFGGASSDQGKSVQQTTDGGYVITGTTESFGAGIEDIYLIKTDANGNLLWAKTFWGTDVDYAGSGQQTIDGGYVIVGSTHSFGAGGYDVYLIKTDSIANSGCNESGAATIANSPPTQEGSPVTFVSSPATIVTSPVSIVGSGVIVTSLCATDINEISTGNSFLFFPNPAFGNFVISFKLTIMKGYIEVLNTLGESIIAENIFNESKKEIDLKKVSNGIYFVKVFDGKKSYCKKLIVEHD